MRLKAVRPSGEDAAEFAVQVGVLRRQPGDVLGDGGVFVGPGVAPAGQDLHVAGIKPGVHPVAVEFDFMQPVGAVRCGLDERRQLRLDPGWERGSTNRVAGNIRGHCDDVPGVHFVR
jgi:hypothetical protein